MQLKIEFQISRPCQYQQIDLDGVNSFTFQKKETITFRIEFVFLFNLKKQRKKCQSSTINTLIDRLWSIFR